MTDAAADVSDSAVLQQRRIRFYTQNFHFLKGWCYAPAGALLLVAALVVGLWQPAWASPTWFGLQAVAACVVATAPWAWIMHRRYRRSFGHVTPAETSNDGPLGDPSVSVWAVIGFFLAAMWWMAVLVFYIPSNTGFQDNHYLLFFAALPLANGIVRPPDRRTQLVYAAGTLLLVGVSLLPLVWADVWAVQTLTYAALGAVALGVGLYNHHLLTDAFGPLQEEDAEEVSADEVSTHE